MDNSSAPVSKDVVDFARLRELFGNDDATIQEMLNIFVTTTEPLLTNLNASISAADFDEIRKLAHQIGGSAANLGIRQMHLLARRLTNAARANAVTQCRAVYGSMMIAFLDVVSVVKNFTG